LFGLVLVLLFRSSILQLPWLGRSDLLQTMVRFASLDLSYTLVVNHLVNLVDVEKRRSGKFMSLADDGKDAAFPEKQSELCALNRS
jgi:hypothetical protein